MSKKLTAHSMGLEWSDPYKVEVEGKVCVVRSAKPTEKFWIEWRKDPDALRALGINPRRYQNEYKVVWWISRPILKNTVG